jgi:hypothetical protein
MDVCPTSGWHVSKLKKQLAPHGCHKCLHTPGLWKHASRPIIFTLVVDDFGIQFTSKQHVQHLIAGLKQEYEAITTDRDGKLFCGIHLDWDYQACMLDLSMPRYVKRALTDFTHPPLSCPEHHPHNHNKPQYGTKLRLTDPPDTTQPLTMAQIHTI